jgi:hypothetical protein
MTQMSPATAAASSRPRDVVFAGVLTIMGSVLALAGIFSTQGELRSSSVRREIESVLADDERFSAIDISVDSVLTMVEAGLMLASAASVAAIVLAVYVMRRHNPSRIALTLLGGVAALLVLISGLAGLAIAVFVAYTVSLLWRRPVRLWFAAESGDGAGQRPDAEPEGADGGTTGAPVGAGSGGGHEPVPPHIGGSDQPQQQEPQHPQQPGPYPGPWPPDAGKPVPPHQHPAQQPEPAPQPGPEQPGPYAPGAGPYGQAPQGYPPEHGSAPGYGGAPGYGQPQGYPQAYPPAYGYTSGYYGYPPAQRDPDSRPGQLVTAHVLTWVGAALGLLTALFLVIAASSQDIVDLAAEQLQSEGVTQQDLVTTMRVGGIVTAVWVAAVLVVSVFSWRRANWAAILLTVMGGVYMLTQLVSLVVMGQVAVLFTIVWVAAVITLLWWPTSRQWYSTARGRGRFGGPAGGQPPYPGMPHQQPPQQPRRNRPW